MPDSKTPADIRSRLLVAGLEHFAARGVDAASLRAIARDAGTSVGMITYYFSTKDGLFFELVTGFYAPLRAELQEIADAHDEPLERLQRLLGRMAAFRPDEVSMGRVIMRELSVRSPRIEQLRPLFMRGHIGLIFDALHKAIAAGQVRDVPIMASLPTLFAPFVMPQLLQLPGLLGIDHEEQAAATFDILMNGLLPRE